MRRCEQMPPRWNTRGDWQNRRHALFCRECRAARRADRKLARGARVLRQEPMPREVEAHILARLGLPPVSAGRLSPMVGGSSDRLGRIDPRCLRVPTNGTYRVGSLVVLALLLVRCIDYPGRKRGSEIATRIDSSSRNRLAHESMRLARAGTREVNLAPAPTPCPPPPILGEGELRSRPRLSPPSPEVGGGGQGVGAGASPALMRARRFRAKNTGTPAPHDDLASLNEDPLREAQRWAPLPGDAWARIEARVRGAVRVKDDFVTIPFPRIASTAARQIAAAADSYQREAAVVDPRLAREVTCAFKATALSDLCDQIRADSGIQLSAGPSVADEKVTVFCEKLPLRDIMRQLSRPFGYTWLRTKRAFRRSGVQALGTDAADLNARTPERLNADYRYELVQDLRSQLLEEELRNQDRDIALLDLEKEIDRYQPYLGLSPDEALARSKMATPEEKTLLETLAGSGWGPIQMYSRLTPQEQAALRAGQKLTFSDDPERVAGASPKPGDWTKPDALPLPPDLGHGVLQSHRDLRVRSDGQMGAAPDLPDGLPPASLPEAHAIVTLQIGHGELGQFTLDGGSGVTIGSKITISGHAFATGISPGVRNPENEVTHADPRFAHAHDPALQGPVSVQTRPDLTPPPPSLQGKGESPGLGSDQRGGVLRPPSPSRGGAGGGVGATPKLTSADVLEALHRASGMPIVADFYTRLWASEKLSMKNRPLFEALNQLADTLHLHWNKDGHWLQFRSASFYDDRLKEVPNRLLSRWAAARRGNGGLPLDDLVEIAQLSDAQLDSTFMAEGARELWGLDEWDLAHFRVSRPHLRYLAGLTPAQRRAAQTAAGLTFTQLSLAQQQQLIAHLGPRLRSLSELAGATVRVEYTQPGGFRWVIPAGENEHGDKDGPPSGRRAENWFGLSLVREPTREAALAAARRIEPQADATQIIPTELALAVVYRLVNPETGAGNELGVRALANGSAHMSW